MVGGLAVVLQGHARLTAHVDLVVDLDEGQALKVIDALTGMGLRPRVPVNPRDFADRSIREGWIRDRMRVVDLFVNHPLPFEELWSRSQEFELRDTTVRVASIPDLIRLKRLAGRPQDHADIEHLEAILQAKKAGTDD